ncbi:oxygenase MpaB family protein [Flavilitoribacter nigricans]|uniref:ER-bound oxygenase mpaB/mpaB'/Rubber oxygenase catalytic domain-containing protein n=1 Tax=Flavilitoribacter nigricans (strain ATCC 23147 / DSM 23189 / NBRC 102662 / NCIMB 1420 / SS-2) TaxID=1122177 RepID=A0A2D0NAF6_FLAN2|nr:oxygenase MpaB family protein [Flavilitoribacter nigricans]PHN05149.1 hypothetical protein CRP01_19205 [Flavilitoribacter nigricans DSM 23189 = NBRC 102662]
MEYFVDKHSIVREIWGKSDTILVIFAGAAAEFALSKAVDWLYFTGRLPSDPLGRLFSTVAYARAIVFAERAAALKAIDTITAIHQGVEKKRGAEIPEWAYRHVLFLLIDYSIRSFELLERPLTAAEKQEVFDVFYRVGSRMGIGGLPQNLTDWEKMRQEQLHRDLQAGDYSKDLFAQYRKHLGEMRYRLLLESQILVVPPEVRNLLGLRKYSLLNPLISLYKLSRRVQLDWVLKELILPGRYKKEIKALNV